MQFIHTPPLSIHNTSLSTITFPFSSFWPLDTRCKPYRADRPRPYGQHDKVKGQRLKRKATENLSVFPFHISHFSFIQQKRTSFWDVLFCKSGDDLLSHNVAGKRVKHQACLSVLQRAGATSWNNYMQCTSCLQYNELQGLPSQGGIIEKRNPELSSRVSK
jgi:hypothetical protein